MTNETFEELKRGIESSELTHEELETLKTSLGDSRSNMTKEQYDALLEAINKAQESTRPFTVVKGDTLAVVGDANDTELKKFEYEITFKKPTYDEEGNLVGKTSETKKYKNVFIAPRQQSKIVKILTMILPYFHKVNEDGSLDNYTPYELGEIFSTMDEEVYDLMYELVACVLHIPREDADYMQFSSVIGSTIKICTEFPEVVNEAESFFD